MKLDLEIKRNRNQLLIGHLLPLVTGFCIYLFFRPHNLIYNEWLNSIGIDLLHNPLIIVSNSTELINFGIYSLPDFLWIFSYCTLVLWVFGNRISNDCLFWLTIILFIAFTSEFSQFFGITSGTFDIMDLIAYSSGVLSSCIIFKRK